MKKILILIITWATTLFAYSQDSIVYRYIIAEPQGRLFSNKCKLRIDDGVKPEKAKQGSFKSITFNSFAAALMYLTQQGWELVSNYNITSGASSNGYGSTSTSTYWILRKPATKEEVENIVKKSLKEEEE